MKNSRKLIALLLVLALAFSFTTFASALPTDTDAWYIVDPKPEPIPANSTVYLTVNSSEIPSDYSISNGPIAITLGASGIYHITDVLVAAHSQYPLYTFYDESGNQINSTSSYLYRLNYNGNNFVPVDTYDKFNGWSFRVNDKLPLLSNPYPYDNPIGASIDQADVQPGDTINLYFSDEGEGYNTDYVRIENATRSGSLVTLTLFSSTSYFQDSDYRWIISEFTAYANEYVKIYNASSGAEIYGDDTNANGEITFALPAGQYTLYVESEFVTSYGVPTRVGVPVTFTI
jgi:hypothetical protein